MGPFRALNSIAPPAGIGSIGSVSAQRSTAGIAPLVLHRRWVTALPHRRWDSVGIGGNRRSAESGPLDSDPGCGLLRRTCGLQGLDPRAGRFRVGTCAELIRAATRLASSETCGVRRKDFVLATMCRLHDICLGQSQYDERAR